MNLKLMFLIGGILVHFNASALPEDSHLAGGSGGHLTTDTRTYPEGDITMRNAADDQKNGTLFIMPDNRIRKITKEEAKSAPWNGIGNFIVQGSHKSWCTAFAISDFVVITAAHCLTYREYEHATNVTPVYYEASIDSFRFFSNIRPEQYDDDDKLYSSEHEVLSVIKGSWFTTHADKDDWAVVTLKTALPKEIYKFTLASPDDHSRSSYRSKNITIAGYPEGLSDLTLHIAVDSCKLISGIVNGVFHHDCPTRMGFSGAPLIVKEIHIDGDKNITTYKVIGINNSYDLFRNSIVRMKENAVPTSTFYAFSQKAIQEAQVSAQ